MAAVFVLSHPMGVVEGVAAGVVGEGADVVVVVGTEVVVATVVDADMIAGPGQGHPDDPREGRHLLGDLTIRAGPGVPMKTDRLTPHHLIEVRAPRLFDQCTTEV